MKSNKVVIAALREERARLVRIATEFGPAAALAAVGFVRCKARHDSGERCQKGEGHGGPAPGYVGHQSENVTWLIESPADPKAEDKPESLR